MNKKMYYKVILFLKRKRNLQVLNIGEQSNVNKITIKTLAASSNNPTNELSVMLERVS